MPAILKISQDRLTSDVKTSDLKSVSLTKQPIPVNQNGFSANILATLGLSSGSVLKYGASGGVAGVAIGGVIGGLVAGPLGVAAVGAVGALAGGGVGAAVTPKHSKDKKVETEAEADKDKTSKLAVECARILYHLPIVAGSLKSWASQQSACRVAVTGMCLEGVSTVAVCLAGGVKPTNGVYKQVIRPKHDEVLEVHDVQGFAPPQKYDFTAIHSKATELVQLQKKKAIHLFLFCIPMTDEPSQLVFSYHIKCLERWFEKDPDLFSKLVIVLTHANEVQKNTPEATFRQFFDAKLKEWQKHISDVCERLVRLPKAKAESIPVVVAGKNRPIRLSENESDTHPGYHWKHQLLFQALSQCKPRGLPVLIKTNQSKLDTNPEGYSNPQEAIKVLVDYKCKMFSKEGREQFEEQSGEAIGLILGVNDNTDW